MFNLHSKAVIFYGPPGAGKGTQANLTANALDLLHVDTGSILEQIVHDPKNQDDPEIQKEKANFDEGRLNTPEFVVRVLKKTVEQIGETGMGIVFSGSPRTLYEAKEIIPVLEEHYGKGNVHVFVLEVPAETSIKRNSNRLVCTVCGAPLLTEYIGTDVEACPRCGGPLYKRELDDPETIKVRLKEYEERTKPIFAFMEERGYGLERVDGTPAPYKVFKDVYQKLTNDTSQK